METPDYKDMLDAGVHFGHLRSKWNPKTVSYTHLRAHETVLDLVCRLLLEKKNNYTTHTDHCVSRLI